MTSTGSHLTIEPDVTTLQPADYVIQVISVAGEVLETYSLRLNSKPN